MKKTVKNKFAFAVAACLVLSGSPSEFARANTTKLTNVAVISSITVNKIKFDVIKEEQLPENIKSKLPQLILKKGYQAFPIKDGGYYVLISSGEKATGGYAINVINVEDNEGKTNIEVKETSPSPDDMVTTAITYPYVVIKISGVTDNFNIKSTTGATFTSLASTAPKTNVVMKAVGSYVGKIDGNSIEVKINGKPISLQLGKLKKTIDKLKLKKNSKVSLSWQTNANGQNMLLSLKLVK